MSQHTVTERTPLIDFLFSHFSKLKKTKIKQILKFGSVLVNGRVVTLHRHPLKPGDTVEILSEKDAFAERLKTELSFQIVYEDTDLVIVEKPSGLLTMGTDKEKELTVYFELTEYQRAKSKDGRGRIFIVHRLDRDSSGLLVFAKNELAKKTLQENWERAVKKYYAIVEGTPEEKDGRVESHLVEDEYRRVYSIQKKSDDSKHAVTHYHLLRENEGYALLDIQLETGRKNQVRVHLSDLGHPIAGDKKYGAETDPIRRLALHAYFLSFPHPTSGKLMSFTSKIPDNFARLVPVSR